MQKRDFLSAAMMGAVMGTVTGTSPAPSWAKTHSSARPLMGPTLLTVSGLIGGGNRGALDPALDQMMAKQKIAFSKAHVFDFTALTALPSITLQPTLEYDRKPHALKGPLLLDVLKTCGVTATDKAMLFLRAVDGYAAQISAAQAIQQRFIVATHLDGRPMALGGLGPLWAVYDADRFPDAVAKPLNERFSACPWALYHVEVKDA